ncbi:MAG: enolase C-terminal domain-like protein [Mycobacterium sp.]
MIDFDDAVVVGIPVTIGFGEPTTRECMLLEGPQGWGEFSPPHDIDDRQAARRLTAAVEPGTVGWPDPLRGRVPVAVAVPAVSPALAHRLVVDSGCRTADVAVGHSTLADDLARLEAVRDALGPGGRIRCDAGGAWDADTAVSVIPELVRAASELEFVTHPCATADDVAVVRRKVDVRVAAAVPSADVLVLDSAALGGVRRSLRVAEKSGLPCVVVAGLETSIGLSAAAALAGVLPDLPFACTIARPSWVAGDVVTTGRAMVATDGHLPVAPMPPAPESTLLAEYALTDAAALTRWQRRLQAARDAL